MSMLVSKQARTASAVLADLIKVGRNSALALVQGVADYTDASPQFECQADAKAWAQSVAYDTLRPALRAYGYDTAHALARYEKGEAVALGIKALSALIGRTFPCVGKVSVRHDGRKTEPTPSKGIDADTFSAAQHGTMWGAFGFSPRAVKEKAHVTDAAIETQQAHLDTAAPATGTGWAPESAPRADDTRYTAEGVREAVQFAVSAALAKRAWQAQIAPARFDLSRVALVNMPRFPRFAVRTVAPVVRTVAAPAKRAKRA